MGNATGTVEALVGDAGSEIGTALAAIGVGVNIISGLLGDERVNVADAGWQQVARLVFNELPDLGKLHELRRLCAVLSGDYVPGADGALVRSGDGEGLPDCYLCGHAESVHTPQRPGEQIATGPCANCGCAGYQLPTAVTREPEYVAPEGNAVCATPGCGHRERHHFGSPNPVGRRGCTGDFVGHGCKCGDFTQAVPPLRTVTIPASQEHNGLHSIRVTLPWTCPQCGGPRGEPYETTSYDGSRQLGCDGWKNPCGHVDHYSAVRDEARELAAAGRSPEPPAPVHLPSGGERVESAAHRLLGLPEGF